MKDELIIVEDDLKVAKILFNNLQLGDVHPRFHADLQDTKVFVQTANKKKAYLIDIHLGPGKEKKGIKIIMDIKKYDSTALIIVYTAYENLRMASYEAGADYFFLKDAETYEKDVNILHDILKREFIYIKDIELRKCAYNIWDKETKIPATLSSVDDKYIHLNCMVDKNEQKIIIKQFPKIPFNKYKNLTIGRPFLLIIKERSKRICFSFEDSKDHEVNEDFRDKKTKLEIKGFSIFDKEE